MTEKLVVNESDLVAMLPFIADWSPELRANFACGFKALNFSPLKSPGVAGLMGVILADEETQAWGAIIPRSECLRIAQEDHLDDEVLAAIDMEPPEGMLAIFVSVPHAKMLVFAPVKAVAVRVPAGQT